jgi:hypothetical protein
LLLELTICFLALFCQFLAKFHAILHHAIL